MPQVYDTCFLFGAGPFFRTAGTASARDLILAADGGYRYCQAAGSRPDLLLGDLDSLETPPPSPPPCKPFRQKRMTPIPCWP